MRTPQSAEQMTTLLKASIQANNVEKMKALIDRSDRTAQLRDLCIDLARRLGDEGRPDSLQARGALAVVATRLLDEEGELARDILAIEYRLDPMVSEEVSNG